jgi:hypothetical protein
MNVMSRVTVDKAVQDFSLRYTPAKVGAYTILQTANPDPLTGKALGPFLPNGQPEFTGPKCTVSCQPDGSLQVRGEGQWAEFEAAAIDGSGNVTFWPGQHKVGPQAVWGTCYKFLGSVDIPVLP